LPAVKRVYSFRAGFFSASAVKRCLFIIKKSYFLNWRLRDKKFIPTPLTGIRQFLANISKGRQLLLPIIDFRLVLQMIFETETGLFRPSLKV